MAYPIGQSLSYSYDEVGNRTGMGSAQGITGYDYDAQDRLTTITNPYSQTTELHYDALDREVRKELANGVVISHTYDAAGRETVLEQRQSSGAAIAVYTATYDNAGNRTGVQELDGATLATSYDASSQLLSETRSGSHAFGTAFTYDALGNRLTETRDSVVTSYTYDANNAVTTATTGATTTTFTYDQNGNRTGINNDGAATDYSWDEENRMIGVVNADSSSESFAYSGDGQRRRKTTDDEDVLYLWDEENVLAELNAGGGLIAQYTDYPGIWGGLSSLHLEGGSNAFSAPLGGMGAFNTVEFNQWGFNQQQSSGGSSDYYYLFDQNASTRYLVDSSEEITDSELYRAFGERVAGTGNTRNPYRFQGQVGPYTDAANWVWMRARSYDPIRGIWYSADPIGFDGGDWNLYRFVRNNPGNWADPLGLQVKARRENTTKGFRPKGYPKGTTLSLFDGYIKVYGGTQADRIKVRDAFRLVANTHVGRGLIGRLRANDNMLSVSINNKKEHYSDGILPMRITIDPNDRPKLGIITNHGLCYLPTPLDVILVHEMGHALLDADDTGDEEFNKENINLSENPYRLERRVQLRKMNKSQAIVELYGPRWKY